MVLVKGNPVRCLVSAVCIATRINAVLVLQILTSDHEVTKAGAVCSQESPGSIGSLFLKSGPELCVDCLFDTGRVRHHRHRHPANDQLAEGLVRPQEPPPPRHGSATRQSVSGKSRPESRFEP